MRIKKLRKSVVDLELKISKNKYVIDTAPEDPKLPGLFVFCGSRGSGKTYAFVAMAKHFEKMGYITRTFLICPTKTSNDIFKNLKTLDEKNDVCDHQNRCKVSLHNIVTEVKKDWKQFEDALKYAKVYKKIVHTGTAPTLEENYILESRNFEIPPPLKKPSHLVIVDDCQGTDMYTMARRDLIIMNHVTSKHRHIPSLFATSCNLGWACPEQAG